MCACLQHGDVDATAGRDTSHSEQRRSAPEKAQLPGNAGFAVKVGQHIERQGHMHRGGGQVSATIPPHLAFVGWRRGAPLLARKKGDPGAGERRPRRDGVVVQPRRCVAAEPVVAEPHFTTNVGVCQTSEQLQVQRQCARQQIL